MTTLALPWWRLPRWLDLAEYTITRTGGAAPPPVTGVSLEDHAGNWTAALTAAAAHSSKTLLVPAGTWPAPRCFPAAGVSIIGAGVGSTFVPRSSAQGGLDLGGFFHFTQANCTISDLTLRGWPVASGLSDDIMINGRDGATNLRVLRVTIENAQGCGIQLQGIMPGALLEDVSILNTLFRSNGFHGVALWLYNGASFATIRRLLVNGAHYAGVMFDAGTESGPALSADDHVLEDVTVIAGSRQALPAGGGTGNGIILTGTKRNTFLRTIVRDQVVGGAFGFGLDQSGLTSEQNVFTDTTVSNISSGVVIGFGGQTGNTFNTGSGAGQVQGVTGNTITNWPGLTFV